MIWIRWTRISQLGAPLLAALSAFLPPFHRLLQEGGTQLVNTALN